MSNPMYGLLLAMLLGSVAAFLVMTFLYLMGAYPECVHFTYSTCNVAVS
jgi:hypothetical protein